MEWVDFKLSRYWYIADLIMKSTIGHRKKSNHFIFDACGTVLRCFVVLKLYIILKDDDSRHREALRRVTSEAEKSAGDLANLSTSFDDQTEKIRSLEVTVDSAYKEIADLQRQLIEKEQNKEAAEKVESARTELKREFDESARKWESERDGLHARIHDLQDAAARSEASFTRREEHLKFEITDLRARLDEAERRNHELSDSIRTATRPLLRQIENLQATNSNQAASFDAIEKSLQKRLQEMQEQLCLQQESDRSVRDTIGEMRAQHKILESQKNEAIQGRNEAESKLQKNVVELEEVKQSEAEIRFELDNLRNTQQRELDNLKKEQIVLEHQLEKEKSNAETEKSRRIQQERDNQDTVLQQCIWGEDNCGCTQIQSWKHILFKQLDKLRDL